jgi:hypothetical protein
MECSRCGTIVIDTLRHCPECGKHVNPNAPNERSARAHNPHYGGSAKFRRVTPSTSKAVRLRNPTMSSPNKPPIDLVSARIQLTACRSTTADQPNNQKFQFILRITLKTGKERDHYVGRSFTLGESLEPSERYVNSLTRLRAVATSMSLVEVPPTENAPKWAYTYNKASN